jgi:site-specific DNA recombinase
MSPPRRPAQRTDAAPTAVGYVRVSREEQVREGVSLDAQRARITAYAEAKDLVLGEILADEGMSGKELERPGLQDLVARCQRGEVRHVIVWKLDRLTRRTRHLLSLVEDLFLARGIELHSVSESLDTSTPHGRFVLTLFGGLAQMEREQIADRTRSALAWKRDQGLPTSHAPLGFRSCGKRQRMEPVPTELETVRRIFALRQEGESYHTIAGRLNRAGVQTKRGRNWHASTIRNVIRQQARYGAVLGVP